MNETTTVYLTHSRTHSRLALSVGFFLCLTLSCYCIYHTPIISTIIIHVHTRPIPCRGQGGGIEGGRAKTRTHACTSIHTHEESEREGHESERMRGQEVKKRQRTRGAETTVKERIEARKAKDKGRRESQGIYPIQSMPPSSSNQGKIIVVLYRHGEREKERERDRERKREKTIQQQRRVG